MYLLRLVGGILFLMGFYFGVDMLNNPEYHDSLLMFFPYLAMIIGINAIAYAHAND